MTDKPQVSTGGAGFFKTLFDQSPYAMQIFSPDGDVVKTNVAWDTLWGVPRSEAVSRYNIFKDKYAQKIGLTATFEQARSGVNTSLHNVEYDPARIGLAGHKMNLDVRMLPLEQVNGQVEGIVCILEDNTEQRQAEKERQSYQERLEREVQLRTQHLEKLLQFSTGLSTSSDLKSLYDFVTLRAKEILQFDHSTLFILSPETGYLTMKKTIGFPQSMVGSFFLLQDEGLPSLVARDRTVAVVEDFHTETRISIPDIIFKCGLTSALGVPMMNNKELIGVLVGHTHAKRTFSASDIYLYQNFANQAAVAISNTLNLRSLKYSEQRFRQIFEHANDAIFIIETDKRNIVDCNRKALLLSNYSRSELVEKKMFELFAAQERQRLEIRKKHVLRTGYFTDDESFQFLQKGGDTIPVEMSSSKVEISGQQLVMNIIRNVSRRKTLEREREETATKLRNASRMEAIGLMAGGVAHDLNNILSGVVSYPELIMMQLPGDSPIRNHLQVVIDSGQRAASVVADLLTVARGASSVKELVSLNKLITEYMESPEIRRVKSLHPKVDFNLRLDPDVKAAPCSAVHIQKVLLNLVTNAAEAIEESSGRVEVATRLRVITENDQVQEPSPGEYGVFSVQDTGAGISQHDLDHIFDPFYTTKKMGRSGTGLGLAVVWNTAQDHDGFITLDSGEQGTTFTFYLPMNGVVSGQAAQQSIALADLHGQGSVLVVDDEQMLREVAEELLISLGYEVSSVNCGEDAVSFLQTNTVDLVLLDMVMEPGINGRQTFEQIIRIHPEQKAIVISGYSETRDIKRIMELGALGLLKKPYTMEQLGRAVRDALQADEE